MLKQKQKGNVKLALYIIQHNALDHSMHASLHFSFVFRTMNGMRCIKRTQPICTQKCDASIETRFSFLFRNIQRWHSSSCCKYGVTTAAWRKVGEALFSFFFYSTYLSVEGLPDLCFPLSLRLQRLSEPVKPAPKVSNVSVPHYTMLISSYARVAPLVLEKTLHSLGWFCCIIFIFFC